VLPNVTDLSELVLTLTATDPALNSEYRLCYKNRKKPQQLRQMNT
jgi:hypothetical protein